MDWNDSIEEDGQEYIILPEGDYNFRVTNFERGRFNQRFDFVHVLSRNFANRFWQRNRLRLWQWLRNGYQFNGHVANHKIMQAECAAEKLKRIIYIVKILRVGYTRIAGICKVNSVSILT